METEQLIKVDPQPIGLDYPWPDKKSISQWWQVCEWPDEYYPGETQDGDEVVVRREDNVWYWVVTANAEEGR